MHIFRLTVPLKNPLISRDLDADILSNMPSVGRILPLQDGGVLVASLFNKTDFLCVRFDQNDEIVNIILKSKVLIRSFIPIPLNFPQEDVFVLLENGLIAHVKLSDGYIVEVFDVDGGDLWDGVAIDPTNFLLTDRGRNEVFTYNLVDKHKEIKVKGLNFPASVRQMKTDQGTLTIVCEFLGNGVRIYDDFLLLQKTIIFKVGSGDGEVRGPNRVIILPTNTLLVSDFHNHRVTEFSLDGTFIRHVLQEEDGIYVPEHLSYQHPYLWIAYQKDPSDENRHHWQVKRFQIYKHYTL